MMFSIRSGRTLLLAAAAVGLGLLAAGCGKKDAPATDAAAGTLADPRDGQKYKTAVIGGRTWMAQNLNYPTESGSWCYGDDKSNCAKYGRLYDWETAKTVCPDGWKLPSRDEWTELFNAASPAADGNELKSASGWDDRVSADDNGKVYKNNGTDNYGFSALPGGYRAGDGSFSNIGGGGSWWTAAEKSNDNAYYMEITWNNGADEGGGGKGNGFSVRCLKVSAAVAGGQRNADEQSAPPEVRDMPDTPPFNAAYNLEIDERDGQQYYMVSIGNQEWMAANLNYQTGSGSWCYGDDKSNCEKYGRLYDWKTAKTACPKGSRLPTREEWQTLVNYAGGDEAGKALKSSSGWNENGNGTDMYGFSALPGGTRGSDGSFVNAGNYGIWWTATEFDGGNAWRWRMSDANDYAEDHGDVKSLGFSVRCIKN
ncbi:hypothetical protein R80B4_02807 [Fibrobacteres bacterium R8-0-B4]